MAVSMRKQIAQNKRNTIIEMILFIIFVSVIGYLFAWLADDISIMIWFFVVSAVYATIQYFLADKIAIASSGAHEITKVDNPRYYEIVRGLADDAKLPMPRVFIINDSAPNAFATGRDPEHACVAATTGLLEIMDDKELRAVMGHELSHVKNFDIRVSMIAFGLSSIVGLIADFGMRVLFYSDRDEENNSPVGVLFSLIAIILAPIVSSIIQLSISRQREYLADASSANLIGNSEDMISALRKLDTHARPMHQQNVASESMYIANPLKKTVIAQLFSTHPSIESRIARLEDGTK